MKNTNVASHLFIVFLRTLALFLITWKTSINNRLSVDTAKLRIRITLMQLKKLRSSLSLSVGKSYVLHSSKSEQLKAQPHYKQSSVIKQQHTSDMQETAMTKSDTQQTRYQQGLNLLALIGGENFDGPINNLANLSTKMARFTVEFPYGDVLSDKSLDLKTGKFVRSVLLLPKDPTSRS